MAQSKATKKFEKNHLRDTIKQRKELGKIKQKNQFKAKKKARREEDNRPADGVAGGQDERRAKKQKLDKDTLADMSMDAFFAGGVVIPTTAAKSGKGIKRSGKRKFTEEQEEDGDSASDSASVASVEEHAVTEDSDPPDEQGEEMGKHRRELNALAKKDPEFFKYLQENDAGLLDFAENANLAEIDDLSDSEEETNSQEKKTSKKKEVDDAPGEDKSTSNHITTVMVRKWSTAMAEQHSLRAMREVVLAFRAGAHLNEEDGKAYKYTISNADVYHEVLLSALKYIPFTLNHHLPIKELPNDKIRIATESKKFRSLTTLLKSHSTSLQHLLENLSDAATVKMTLSSILALLPYILSFKKLIRELSRTVVEIWSDSAHSEATRISAFLILRRLVVIGDPGIKETVLRTTYQGLIKGSRTTTMHNLPGINLMKNSAGELWGLADPNVAYTTGFTFIRQLAIHLRNSIKNNANDSYKTVYNWQYVHSLDFWSRVLSTHCETLHEASSGKQSPLRPLIYPLTQVTLGATRLIPTAAYFPLRFQLLRSLLRISNSTHTYIPLATPLYEVLTSAEMKKPPKPSTLKPLDFDTNIRVTKSYLRTRVYQDGVGEQVAELLAEFFTLWTKNIAFPELALPVIVMLKKWLKEVSPYRSPAQAAISKKNKAMGDVGASSTGGNRNMKINTLMSVLIQKLDANAKFIEERRAKVEFAPNARAGVEGFLKEMEWSKTPLGAFVDGQRKVREQRRRVVEEGRRAEEVKKARNREDENGGDQDSSEDMEDQ